MPLINTAKILQDARANNYCIGAFNIENFDMAKAIIESAEEMRTPAIIQTTFTTVNYAGAQVLSAMVQALAENSKAEIALHLDHGNTIEICRECIIAGYNSVMIDGSHFSLADNIAITKKVVDFAREKGVSVEGEIGRVGGTEDELTGVISYTDVAECIEFAEMTQLDFVAIGVGTAHGLYSGEPEINFKRIRELREAVRVPLVLHGASGLSSEIIKECIASGISKINFATELRQAYTQGVREALSDDMVYDPKVYQRLARDNVREVVKQKIGLLN